MEGKVNDDLTAIVVNSKTGILAIGCEIQKPMIELYCKRQIIRSVGKNV